MDKPFNHVLYFWDCFNMVWLAGLILCVLLKGT